MYGGHASASATAESPVLIYLPHDIGAGIIQPTEPVVRFAWVIGRVGGNNKNECKLCRNRFTGQKALVVTHFGSTYSSQRVAKCIATQPRELVDEIEKLMSAKKKDEDEKSNKRSYSALSTKSDISTLLKGQGKPLADSAILEFIVCQGISASIVDSSAFRNLIKQVASAGSGYCPPRRHIWNTEVDLCRKKSKCRRLLVHLICSRSNRVRTV